jgi:hypothetical protein
MILKEYIKKYLHENLKISDIAKIELIIDRLTEKCLERKKSLEGDEELYNHYIFGHLDNVAYTHKPRLQEIGEGVFRKAYAIPDEEWVLKLSIDNSGSIINRQEVEISQGKHGISARDIFVKIYDYDKLDQNPKWIICQKVIPLEKISDVDILKKVFPTFWNVIRKNSQFKKNSNINWLTQDFIQMIGYVMTVFGQNIQKNKGSSTKEMFYNAAKRYFSPHISNEAVVDFEEFVMYEDIERINKAYAYISSVDMHEGNFGVVDLSNPSPKSIVILDFDIN